MDATFERMIAQAVRGSQAAGPPQDPTVPDKCVLFLHFTSSSSQRVSQW